MNIQNIFTFIEIPNVKKLDIGFSPLLRSYSLYISFKFKIADERKSIFSPERTEYNSPGQTECRPGFENGYENRPHNSVHQRENLISDETENLVFLRNDILQFRPKH